MVTIQNLEIRLEVEGDGDEAVFSRYFDKYIRKWSKLMEEAKARQLQSDRDRALGDREDRE